MIPQKFEVPILITDRVNTRWLHRLPMSQGAILLSENKRIFYSWGRSIPESLPNGLEIRPVDRALLGEEVAKELEALNASGIALESNVPYDLFKLIENAGVKDIRVVEGTAGKWREIKDDWEIAQLKKASEITDNAFAIYAP